MSSAKNHTTIYLNDTDQATLHRNCGRSVSAYVSLGIKVIDSHKVMIFQLTNRINGRIFFGIDNLVTFHHLPIMDRITKKQTAIYSDILEYGSGSFDVRSIGCFSTIKEASDYMDFLINKTFDEGDILYNEELFTGFTQKTITAEMDHRKFIKLIELCHSKKITIGIFINKVVDKFLKANSD